MLGEFSGLVIHDAGNISIVEKMGDHFYGDMTSPIELVDFTQSR